MMDTPPHHLDGATVLKFADLSTALPTGETRHVIGGNEVSDFARLAIARYESKPGFYLFYCDEDWSVLTDTFHESLSAAVRQAEFEFGDLSFADASSAPESS
jgi:hypothetical protein